MKIQITVFFLLMAYLSNAQNRVFFAKSDACSFYFKEPGNDSVFLLKQINRCENYSITEQVSFEKNSYSRNGHYIEYYDTAFQKVKKTGNFKNGIETGVWKEYYPNGNLKYEGTCNMIKVIQPRSNPNKLWIIDFQHPEDTLKLSFSLHKLDSIRKLEQFHYFPSFERKGYMLPDFYSLKNGVWLYYSPTGILIKKEVYKNGILITSH